VAKEEGEKEPASGTLAVGVGRAVEEALPPPPPSSCPGEADGGTLPLSLAESAAEGEAVRQGERLALGLREGKARPLALLPARGEALQLT
jgi:hypothetical protein